MRKASAKILLLAVLVVVYGISGSALANDSDDVIIENVTENGDIDAEGDVLITGSLIDGEVEADGSVTVVESEISDEVEGESTVTIENSEIGGEIESDSHISIVNSIVGNDVEADGDVTIDGSTIEGELEADGNIVIGGESKVYTDIEADGDITIDHDSEIDGELEADGEIGIVEQPEDDETEEDEQPEDDETEEDEQPEDDNNGGEQERDDEIQGGEHVDDEGEEEREEDEESEGGGEGEMDAGSSSDQRDGQSDFTILAPSLDTTQIAAGDNLRIELRVENVGSRDGTFEEELIVDGEVVSTGSGDIEAGQTETIELEHRIEEPGEYEIAVGETSFETLTVTDSAGNESTIPVVDDDQDGGFVEVLDAIAPADWVKRGYETTVRATVINRGSRTANRTLTVTVDARPVANETVTLEPNQRTVVTIELEPVSGTVAVEGVAAGTVDVSENPGTPRTGTDHEVTRDGVLNLELGIVVLVGVFGLLVSAAILRARAKR